MPLLPAIWQSFRMSGFASHVVFLVTLSVANMSTTPTHANVLLTAHEPKVFAPSHNPVGIPQDLIQELLAWIGAATGYDTGIEPPEIAFCNTGDCIPYSTDTLTVDETLNGAYDWLNTRIILVRPWDANRPLDVSVLLHELVHHVQLANRTFECTAATEWEAYKLQADYLAQHGIASGFNWSQIYLQSNCRPDAHP